MVQGTQIDKYEEKRLTMYAPRAEIREAMERFKAGMAVKDATEHEYAALAHLCIAHGLDPFNGEAWIIPSKGVCVGIKGARKMANKQADERNFRWWTEFHDIRSTQEAKQYGVPDDAIAAVICELRRSDHIESYVTTLKMLQDAGMPYDDIIKAVGHPPVVIGIGYVKQGEKSVMPLPQLVRKRAEKHAITQVFDVPFVSEDEPMEALPSGFTEDENVVTVVPSEPEPHWIKNEGNRKFWWGEVKRRDLDHADAHAALNVEHIEEFAGTMEDAIAVLDEYVAYQQQALEEAGRSVTR